ncbi:MAG: hypothetical protein LQ349_007731, partial [Xanthoria aureola]
MGRELQKKKNRSSLHKIKHKPKSKKLNIRANPIVARNWNKHETLTQNYRRLGLVSKLNPRAGGTEPLASSSAVIPPPGAGAKEKTKDSLAIREPDADVLVPGTARIVRDKGGKVVRVLYHDREDKGERKREVEWRGRRLVDELGDDDDVEGDERVVGTQHEIFTGGKDDEEEEGVVGNGIGNGVVRQLAMAARRGERKKGGRKQSRREEEWVGR